MCDAIFGILLQRGISVAEHYRPHTRLLTVDGIITFRYSEIDQDSFSITHKYVGRLYIQMQYIVVMQIFESIGNLTYIILGYSLRHRGSLTGELFQRPAFHMIHNIICSLILLEDRDHPDDVRMIESGYYLGFLYELVLAARYLFPGCNRRHIYL